jgi:hypothetical protein
MIYHRSTVDGRELIYRVNVAACAGRGEAASFVAQATRAAFFC